MKTAYEKWLLMKIEGEDLEGELAELLWEQCYNGNALAFELVDRAGDKHWSFETFEKAAALILKEK